MGVGTGYTLLQGYTILYDVARKMKLLVREDHHAPACARRPRLIIGCRSGLEPRLGKELPFYFPCHPEKNWCVLNEALLAKPTEKGWFIQTNVRTPTFCFSRAWWSDFQLSFSRSICFAAAR